MFKWTNDMRFLFFEGGMAGFLIMLAILFGGTNQTDSGVISESDRPYKEQLKFVNKQSEDLLKTNKSKESTLKLLYKDITNKNDEDIQKILDDTQLNKNSVSKKEEE